MLWNPQPGLIRRQNNLGGTGTNNFGTAVECPFGGGKGDPEELIAATAFDAYWVRILAAGYGVDGNVSRCCLDILIGAATEEILIADLLAGASAGNDTSNSQGVKSWEFPLYIPAGSRLAARAAGDRDDTFQVGIALYGGNGYPPFRVGGRVTTYGTGTVPDGTAVAPGASGAEGNWIQIAASTSADHFAFVPSFQPGNDSSLTPTKTFFADLGLGAAASEDFIGGTEQSYMFRYDVTERCGGPFDSFPTFADVPSGTRLAARLSASGAVSDADPQMSIHAVS